MQWLDYDTTNCSIRRALDVVGEKWTLLVLREAFNGVGRFDQIRDHVGISDAILADRLSKLTEADVLFRTPYREAGQRSRYEYKLTAKGRRLYPVILALLQWGDDFYADAEGPSVEVVHDDCGQPVELSVSCAEGHAVAGPFQTRAIAGPGAIRRKA